MTNVRNLAVKRAMARVRTLTAAFAAAAGERDARGAMRRIVDEFETVAEVFERETDSPSEKPHRAELAKVLRSTCEEMRATLDRMDLDDPPPSGPSVMVARK